MPRIQGLTEVYLTGDALLKAAGTVVELHQIVVAAEGATAGNKIVFRNGSDGAAEPALVVVIEAANQTIPPIMFPQGKRLEAGCFVDFSAVAGKVHLSLTYK